jgi:hypothetical protein
MLAIAEEDRVGTPGDHGRDERRDAGAVLDREGWRRDVTQRKAEGALDGVTEPHHRPAVATRGLSPAPIFSFRGATAPANLATFSTWLLVGAPFLRSRIARRCAGLRECVFVHDCSVLRPYRAARRSQGVSKGL